MKAVIMAGGKGTRLYPLTKRIPKPMVPVIDRPVLEYTLAWLKEHHVEDVIITLSYLPDIIRDHFGDGRRFGMNISYFEDPYPLGTAGSIKNADQLLSDTFFVVSGDGVTNMNLTSAYRAHREKRVMASLLLQAIDCPLGYGVVEIDEEGSIKSFREKPTTWDTTQKYLINTGIYILEPEILSYIPPYTMYDFGHQLFPKLLEQSLPLYGYEVVGYWSDIGTLQQYYQTQLDILNMPIGSIAGWEKERLYGF